MGRSSHKRVGKRASNSLLSGKCLQMGSEWAIEQQTVWKWARNGWLTANLRRKLGGEWAIAITW